MIRFIITFLIFFFTCNYAYAGGFIVSTLISEAFAATFAGQVIAFAINMVASTILSKVFAPSAPDQSNLNAQQPDRKSTRLNSSHSQQSRMPSSA